MSTWTKEKPTPGEYWLSLAPKNRTSRFQPVIQCRVFASQYDPPGQLRVWVDDGHYRPLSDPYFEGAQWRLVEGLPADPFAEPPPSYSQDNDLP